MCLAMMLVKFVKLDVGYLYVSHVGRLDFFLCRSRALFSSGLNRVWKKKS